MQKIWTVTYGQWSTAANWLGREVPVPGDDVLINPETAAGVSVLGSGKSNSLNLTGKVALSGSFATGTLSISVADPANAPSGGRLTLGAGTTLTTNSALLGYGSFAVIGAGTRLTVSDTLVLGSAIVADVPETSALSVQGGAAVQVANLTMQVGVGIYNSISVDSASSLEVGTAGAAISGALTVDAGRVLRGEGSVGAPAIFNAGTIEAQGDLTLNASSGGSGMLVIDDGATLALGSLSDPTSNDVSFAGGGGTLSLHSYFSPDTIGYLPNLSGAIHGFGATDLIRYAGGPAVNAITYVANGQQAGVITLFSDAKAVGKLTIAGNYDGASFHVFTDTTTGSAAISVLPAGTNGRLFLAQTTLFNSTYYLNQNPDVRAAGIDPLAHFEANGWREGRDASVGFSVAAYLTANPDVKAAGVDPLVHYVQSGKAEGRLAYAATPHDTGPHDPAVDDAYVYAAHPELAAAGLDASAWFHSVGWTIGANPSALFNTAYYLNQNPDIKAAGIDPLAHFESNGWREGRDPSVLFSIRGYQSANPDVKAAGLNPLLHYVQSGRPEGRAAVAAMPHDTAPHDALVDDATVYAAHPEVAVAGLDASAWFHGVGWKAGANPDALFDTSYYLTQNPDVAAAGLDPLAHFESNGWREGREPSLMFSDAKYLAAYPDVKAAGIDPLVHYLGNGRAEGRMAFLAGGTATADPLVNATYFDRQLGAMLIPGGAVVAQQAASLYDTIGWQRGLNPDTLFDTTYYLSRNPDVAAAHIDPLLHYEASGWKEGRDPSALFSTNKYLGAYADVRAAGINPLLHYVVNGQAEGRQAFAV